MTLTPERLRVRLERYDSDDMLVDFTKGELREMLALIDSLQARLDDHELGPAPYTDDPAYES